MSETINIGEIAAKLSKDIFKHFMWEMHPKHDDNFLCSIKEHLGEGKKKKDTHPGDVVFYYDDPYLGKRIYLHTDLKSYAKDSITSTSLRNAFKSLCMTIECAKESQDWRQKYSVDASEQHEVRGLLFIHNHDNGYGKPFYDAVDKVNLQNLPIAPGSIIHFLGPQDIQRLYSIANDIIRLKHEDILPKKYSFYYPDMVMIRRQGDVWNQPATIETLTSPYIIIKHECTDSHGKGYIIYYNATGACTEEFEYFLDSLSRYQMLDSGEEIKVRVTHSGTIDELRSKFHMAKKKYIKAWGFDPIRAEILESIEIDEVTSVTNTYNPGKMGWKE